MANGFVVKKRLYIVAHVIEFVGFASNEDGEPAARFLIFNEDGDLVETLSLPRNKVARREDVTFAAEKKLGVRTERAELKPPMASREPPPQ